MRWVVLSDIHYEYKKNYDTTELKEKLIDFLKEDRERNGRFTFVLITGDCMFQHRDDGCADYINRIIEATGVKKEELFISPGNHDVNRRDEVRNRIIDEFRAGNQIDFPVISDDMMGYDRFCRLFYKVKGEEYCHFSVYTSNSECAEKYRIINIDSCLLSKDKNDFQKLKVYSCDLSPIKGECKDDEYLNIVMMHHGCAWLNPHDNKNFQHWLSEQNIDVVFCGHEHEAGKKELEEAEGIKEFTCGCCVFDKDIIPSFYICEHDPKENDFEIKIKLHTFQGKGRWDLDSTILQGFPQGIYNYKIPRKNVKAKKSQNPMDVKIKQVKVFNNLLCAHSVINEELHDSKFFKFFGLRGSTYVGGVNEISKSLISSKDIVIKFLVSSPFSEEIYQRLKNIPELAYGDKYEWHWRGIYRKLCELQREYQYNPMAQIRYHKMPLIFRLIITEQHLYLSYYETGKNIEKSEVYQFPSDSAIYKTYNTYFEYIWSKSKSNIPQKIPAEYSFLEEKFKVAPLLTVNISDKCNMQCRYCPDGGENLQIIDEKKSCETKDVLNIVKCFNKKVADRGRSVLRITGGEPLLRSNRNKTEAVLDVAKKYNKIIMCTNGVFFEEAYRGNSLVWERIKDKLLLKISLDTLKQDVFSSMTNTDLFNAVMSNIKFAKEFGFQVELNTVVTPINVLDCNDILELFDFAYNLELVGVKIMTVNDFRGRVEDVEINAGKEKIHLILQDLIVEMQMRGYEEKDLYLEDNKGILMKQFIAWNKKGKKCTFTIVDHSPIHSITPRRTYSSFCDECIYYPRMQEEEMKSARFCSTGIMSLVLSTDGFLMPCRLRKDAAINIQGLSERKIEQVLENMLKEFDSCFHKTIYGGIIND